MRSNSVPVDLPIIIFTNFNHMNRSYGCTRTAQKNNLFVFPQWLLRFLKKYFNELSVSSVEAWFGPRSHSISKNKIEQNLAWVKNKIIHTIYYPYGYLI